ncbi:MAG: hypothetical protein E5V92_08520 [Mesorhizobium sp.]|uniref:hypothetical protein n=1 Tax=unclassified Mesorhizobium TaxID=325217 RepID=UPI000F75362E|nr:hypothetical protein [Mesorhizobium sp. M1D.F.Ca.ET.043.01.1.1]AZO75235.1 hypothetical protein EJ067_31725 [Mesorhizobium sp. M1D.F.Ca.ET.043.01.1.1]RWA90402.1 MAG: hypothetical protein EOQ32_19320 [Mesorhizobium sp.]RWE04517.1 MAG: hypothetical protein EOS61_25605 [Mesorhizobium sp.]TJW87701.1 MAG: hypothetical protein E5V92_08520 [Mesorhizobium sp.]
MPATLTIAGIQLQMPTGKQKAGPHFGAARQGRQEWRGKAGHVPAWGRTIELPQKFQKKSIVAEKNSPGMAAMQLLHCTIVTNHLYS